MRDRSKKSDFELLKLLKRHDDSSAFEEIYNRYWSKLYDAAFKRVRCTEAAAEIVQQVFTSIWQQRREIDERTVLAANLLAFTRYHVIDRLQHKLWKRTGIPNQ
jgi:RNA polymerase sigma-70 factor (ECF subfamily)